MSVGDGARRPGLTLSVSPRSGAPATASDALWRDHLFHRRTPGAPGGETDERALAARVDYGLQLGGLLTPFGLYGHPQYGRRLQLGLLLGPAPARWAGGVGRTPCPAPPGPRQLPNERPEQRRFRPVGRRVGEAFVARSTRAGDGDALARAATAPGDPPASAAADA